MGNFVDAISASPDAVLRAESRRAGHSSAVTRPKLSCALIALVDLLVLSAVAALAAIGRTELPLFTKLSDLDDSIIVIAPLLVVGWMIALAIGGAYRSSHFGAGVEEYRSVLYASIGLAAAVGIACFMAKYELSRGFFVLVFVLGTTGLLLSRAVLRRALHRARVHGRLTERTLLVGSMSHVDEIATVLSRETWLGFTVVGAAIPDEDTSETSIGVPVLGTPEEALELVAEQDVQVVLIASGGYASARELREAAWEMEQFEKLRIILAPGMTDVAADRVQTRPVAGLPLVHLEQGRWRSALQLGKRVFDVFGALAALMLLLPLLLVTALWIWLDDRGPVLFSQTRVGVDGELFQVHKFRSMVIDAEARLAKMARREDHVLFKSAEDPRITRPGRFIRRFSIDELPQLLNVLKGEMSLIGPRPPLPTEVAQYPPRLTRRLNVRPGMTGLWQVSGRSDLSWEDTMRLDLYYVDNWSMLQDLSILLRTVRAVLASRGAY